MANYSENSRKQLKFELNVRFAEVNDQYHAFTMLHRQGKSKIGL